MRTALSITVVALLAACAPAGRSGGGGSVVAGVTSPITLTPTPTPTAKAPTTAPTTAPTVTATVAATASASPATYPTPLELARRHAPLYRFNAYVPGGDTSPQNRSEEFFPMSVKEFFDELAHKNPRVAVTRATNTNPGTNAVVGLPGGAFLSSLAIENVPFLMAGDVPGTAPVYIHSHEDKKLRVRHPDGSGEDLVYVEFWLFYGQDSSGERFAFYGPTFDVGGHRGDWEEISLAIAVRLGPGGAFRDTVVRRGFFAAHSRRASVELADLELVDDQGAPGHAHPVVYVAVGKHASYPRAGTWEDPFGLLPLLIHDEYFRGNGFAWSSWRSPLLDLEGPSSAEFAPASFLAITVPGLGDWRDFKGTWGTDSPPTLPGIGVLPFGDSPRGPRRHGSYGAGARGTQPWAAIQQQATGLDLRASTPVLPVPVPLRLP